MKAPWVLMALENEPTGLTTFKLINPMRKALLTNHGNTIDGKPKREKYYSFLTVPEEIHDAAQMIATYFNQRNIKGWRLGGIADRRLVDDSRRLDIHYIKKSDQYKNRHET